MTIAPASPAQRPSLLFVDDEPAVLEAISTNLSRQYDVVTATSGAEGLEHLEAESDFTVVVSDMRMPKMDGATFLALARETAPDTVRMLLTGQTDLNAAIKAVNHGKIFRFLTKPCPRDTLRLAIESAVEQHRLITGEHVLLEQTLRGAVKVLVDVLAITNPTAFGRAHQIRSRVVQLATQLGILDSWQLEIAAMASQLGYVALPDALCTKLERNEALNDDELRMLSRAPVVAEQLLAHIPRLEGVRAILALHIRPPARDLSASSATQLVELGAHLLRIAIDIEAIDAHRSDRSSSPVGLLVDRDRYDPEVLEAVDRLYSERSPRLQLKKVSALDLRPGMVLGENAFLTTGMLLVARGYEVTEGFIERIKNFPSGMVIDEFKIIVPHQV
jgi:CheY-like chemotaxis protein